MPDPKILRKIQAQRISEALDIAEQLSDGENEESFSRARHYSAPPEYQESVVVAELAKVVINLHQRVEELEAKSAKKSGASSKERSKKSA